MPASAWHACLRMPLRSAELEFRGAGGALMRRGLRGSELQWDLDIDPGGRGGRWVEDTGVPRQPTLLRPACV